MPDRHYKAVFFDLDGTLLPMDTDMFLEVFFTGLDAFVAENGHDPRRFAEVLTKGIHAMCEEEGGTNESRFWDTFLRLAGEDAAEYEVLVNRFYEEHFPQIGREVVANPAAGRVVNALHEKGYRLFLTTMPLFPRNAVEARLRWAGVDPSAFERITTYDKATTVKPNLAYYQENVDASGLDAHDILMVGNNTREDMVAMELGLDGYLVTDYLIDPIDFDMSTVKHGDLAAFEQFVASLPAVKEL